MAINYKTLFEVKLLHEYYLTRQDGIVIFSIANQSDRLNFLMDQFSRGRGSINNDLLFELPYKAKKEYNDYNIKLVPTYSGFKVAVRVNQKRLGDNSLVFEPFVPLPDGFSINILFSARNNFVDAYTSSRISSALPGTYFFSNDSNKIFPFLTNAPSPQDPGYNYEQGELASFGPNDIRGFYQNAAGDQWEPFSGSAFANENDRLLLPLKFRYSFPTGSQPAVAGFTLKNKDGEIIQSFNFTNDGVLEKKDLDFSGKRDLLVPGNTSSLPDFTFSLEVTGDNGYARTHPVLFNDLFFGRPLWAMASILLRTNDPNFSSIANDGYLVKRKDPAGIWTNAPVFEIPVKSKFTFWRYIHERGKKLDLIPDLQDYLFEEGGMLLTKKPRSIARSFFLLQKEGSADTKYTPNPVSYALSKDSKQRLCFDIVVPKSALFPVLP